MAVCFDKEEERKERSARSVWEYLSIQPVGALLHNKRVHYNKITLPFPLFKYIGASRAKRKGRSQIKRSGICGWIKL